MCTELWKIAIKIQPETIPLLAVLQNLGYRSRRVHATRLGDVNQKMIEGFHHSLMPIPSIYHALKRRVFPLQYGIFQPYSFRFLAYHALNPSHVTIGKI